ncbi:hypothetical protein BOO30_17505 [Vibrio navarrensis]|nr:hypothetical protein [Vibrio navarrensis]MBE4587723.1 hypothetical protein [Vibrio navarrensis]MBE4598165.1 hypothetical protein [Vibrio navarrensis]MBE4609211.1 hypothetical protein [Vibrio navarrensis]MBE4612822.1 hypothetical protein [Vibrio navarrensis]
MWRDFTVRWVILLEKIKPVKMTGYVDDLGDFPQMSRAKSLLTFAKTQTYFVHITITLAQ